MDIEIPEKPARTDQDLSEGEYSDHEIINLNLIGIEGLLDTLEEPLNDFRRVVDEIQEILTKLRGELFEKQ